MSTWSTPITFTAAAALTAAQLNGTRDNLTHLKGSLDLISNSTTADTGTTMYLSITRALAADTSFRALVTGDTVPRLAVLASGKIEWGSGSAAADISIFRGGANSLNLSTTVFDVGGAYTIYTERAEPGAAAANTVNLYARDNGAGKTQIVAKFSTGAVQVMATEP